MQEWQPEPDSKPYQIGTEVGTAVWILWLSAPFLTLLLSLNAFPSFTEVFVLAILWGAAVCRLIASFITIRLSRSGNLGRQAEQDGEFWTGSALFGFVLPTLATALIAWTIAQTAFGIMCVIVCIAWVNERVYTFRSSDGIGIFEGAIFYVSHWSASLIWKIMSSPCRLVMWAWQAVYDARLCRTLRHAFSKPDMLAYFVYSELHQRTHFLGPDGALHHVRQRVTPRNWRTEISPARQAIGWTRYNKSPEGAILKRFGVTNMRDHLPMIVILGPGNRMVPIFFSEAYRKRARDEGDAVREIERELEQAIANAEPGRVALRSSGP